MGCCGAAGGRADGGEPPEVEDPSISPQLVQNADVAATWLPHAGQVELIAGPPLALVTYKTVRD